MDKQKSTIDQKFIRKHPDMESLIHPTILEIFKNS